MLTDTPEGQFLAHQFSALVKERDEKSEYLETLVSLGGNQALKDRAAEDLANLDKLVASAREAVEQYRLANK